MRSRQLGRLNFWSANTLGAGGSFRLLRSNLTVPASRRRARRRARYMISKSSSRSSTAQWNVYFSVNPLRTELHMKASKTDVLELAYLHADIDPRDGYTLNQERHRI